MSILGCNNNATEQTKLLRVIFSAGPPLRFDYKFNRVVGK